MEIVIQKCFYRLLNLPTLLSLYLFTCQRSAVDPLQQQQNYKEFTRVTQN